MKRLVVGFAVAAVWLGAADIASASDMAVKARAPSAVPNWSGFYVGLHAGWAFANANATSRTDFGGLPVFAPASFDVGDSGALAGGQIGYNWQFGNWVFGLEADISGTGIGGFESQVPVRVIGLGAPADRCCSLPTFLESLVF